MTLHFRSTEIVDSVVWKMSFACCFEPPGILSNVFRNASICRVVPSESQSFQCSEPRSGRLFSPFLCLKFQPVKCKKKLERKVEKS